MPISREEIERTCLRLRREAESGGYHLNSDEEFTKELIEGILTNQERYGYWSCPCRLASGDKTEDLDIICPCDYRDPDLLEHNACYCALYVSQKALSGEVRVTSIPERRPPRGERKQFQPQQPAAGIANLPYPVWRCRVCGYLCAREEPPEVCPICKAKKERFERFI
jgi:ferredoxin-thioredoxin reductase catalytic subunit